MAKNQLVFWTFLFKFFIFLVKNIIPPIYLSEGKIKRQFSKNIILISIKILSKK